MLRKVIIPILILAIFAINFSFSRNVFAAIGDYTGISFDTGGNADPQGAVEYGGFFYFVDNDDNEVYKFNIDGTYTGTHFDTAGSGADNVFDITTYNDFFWITDFTDDEVYKYNPDGTYTGVSFDTAASGAGNVTGITAYNDFFWLVDSSDDEVYKYNPDGTYTGVHFDTNAAGVGNAGSILAYNDLLLIADGADDLIYLYNPDGTYTGTSYDLSAVTIGIDGLAVYNDFLWIIDDQEDLAYQFDPLNDLTGVFFDTTINGTASPHGITTDGSNFWIIGDAYENEKVVEYELDGTYTGDFFFLDPAHQGGSDFFPEVVFFYDGFLWIGTSVNDVVYKYNPDGTYTGISFNTDVANADLGGIAMYNDFFWITDTGAAEVFKYNLDGTYTGISFDTAADGVFSPAGIVAYNDFFWIVDSIGGFYKYNTDGTYTGISYSTFASGNVFPYGITVYDDFFYITQQSNKEVYKYEGDPAPTVSTLSPVDGGTDVAIDSNLVITFTEAVDVGVGNILIKKVSDDSIVQTIDVTGGLVTGTGTDTITINPSDLEEGVAYYIQIDATAFNDLGGFGYAGISNTTTWNFTTVEPATSGGGSSGSVRHVRDDDPVTPPPPTPPVVPVVDPVTETEDPTPPVLPVIEDEEVSIPEVPTEEPVVEEPTVSEEVTPVIEEESEATPIVPEVQVETVSFVDSVSNFVKSPVGKVASRSLTLAALGLAFLVGIFANVGSLADIGLNLLRFWSMFLYGVGLKKRNRPWGVVYDSVTKQPLDPVYVVLLDLQGKEVATSITDMDGRYGFLVEPGIYKIKVNKNNYTFPSTKLVGKTSDELYSDLYFGETIEIKEKDEVIAKNIPMDQIGFNWNEFAKKEQGKMKFYHTRDVVLSRFTEIFTAIGFLVSFAILFVLPEPYNVIVFCLYLVLFSLKHAKLIKKKKGSVVYGKSGIPISYGIIRMYGVANGVEMAHRVLDKKGSYYMLIGNGEYVAMVEKKNEDGSYTKVFSDNKVIVKHGILKKNFRV